MTLALLKSRTILLLLPLCLCAGCSSCDDDVADPVDMRVPDVSDLSDMGADGGVDLGPARKIGEPCAMSAGCEQGAVCVTSGQPGELERCYHSCTMAGRLCAQNGALCVASQFPQPVCYTGGTGKRGEACTDSTSCASGLTCLRGKDQAAGECKQACHKDDAAVCVAPEQCKIAADDGRGYCAAP